MSTPTLTRAARLLDESAAELLLCHTTDGDWGDDHDARDAHAEMMRVAGELRGMLAAAPEAPEQAAQPADVARLVEDIDWIDDFIARCTGDDRGACSAVSRIRAALAAKGGA